MDLEEVGIAPPVIGVKRNAVEGEIKEERQSLTKRAREADPLEGSPTPGSPTPSGRGVGRKQLKPARTQWPSDGDRRRKEATVMSSWTRTPRGRALLRSLGSELPQPEGPTGETQDREKGSLLSAVVALRRQRSQEAQAMDVDREATLISLLENQQEPTPAGGGGRGTRLLVLESLGSICPADMEEWRSTAAAKQLRENLPPTGGEGWDFLGTRKKALSERGRGTHYGLPGLGRFSSLGADTQGGGKCPPERNVSPVQSSADNGKMGTVLDQSEQMA
jgi:hypothetical protein